MTKLAIDAKPPGGTDAVSSASLDLRLVRIFRQASAIAAVVVGALGSSVLVGWAFDIAALKSVHSDLATMKANTAVAFVVLGVGLWFAQDGDVVHGSALQRLRARRIAAICVVSLAALTGAQDALGVDFGIDNLLVQDTAMAVATVMPGRMAPGTAINFCLLGGALLSLDVRARFAPARVATFLVTATSSLAFFGYVYGVHGLYSIGYYSSLALHTTIGFLLASAAVFLARPEQGLAALLAANTSAGGLLRRLLPTVSLVLPLLAWLRLHGQRAGLYDPEFGIAGAVVTSVALLATVTCVVAASLHRSEIGRRRAQAELVESEEAMARAHAEGDVRRAAVLRSAFDAILWMDDAGCVIEFNPAAESLFGYRRHEVIGKRMVDLIVPPSEREAHRRGIARYLETGESRIVGKVVELSAMRQDRSEFPVEVAVTRVEGETQPFFAAFLRDRSEHQRAAEALRTLNAELETRVQARTVELTSTIKERDVLLQEVHHRVKNNLQVISSLIHMQASSIVDPASKNALEECRMRVQAIALIHAKLYQTADFARVPFSAYAKSLAEGIFHAAGTHVATISLDLAIDDVRLAVDKAIPCGLVLNELITNALKHAFRDGRAGGVRVELQRVSDGRLRLAVSDDGVGLPRGVDVRTSESLGLQLVTTLAEQLEADLEVKNDVGTSVSLTFHGEA